MHKTEKSKLTSILENQVEDHGTPVNVEAKIFDGFFLLRTMKNVPTTFGELSIILLKLITKAATAGQIFLIFDVYKTNSIKDCEHAVRSNYSMDFCITGDSKQILDRGENRQYFKSLNKIY